MRVYTIVISPILTLHCMTFSELQLDEMSTNATASEALCNS